MKSRLYFRAGFCSVNKQVNRLFNKFTGTVGMRKTRNTGSVLRAPKLTRGQLPCVNLGALRKR